MEQPSYLTPFDDSSEEAFYALSPEEQHDAFQEFRNRQGDEVFNMTTDELLNMERQLRAQIAFLGHSLKVVNDELKHRPKIEVLVHQQANQFLDNPYWRR